MGEIGEYDFTEVSKQIARNEGIQNAVLKMQYSTKKGDGYIGVIKALQLVGSNKTLDLIFKYSPRSAKLHEKTPMHETFVNENNFYDFVYPTFEKFQDDQGISDRFDNIAKCYASVNERRQELLVLENLRSLGYDLWDRKQLMNREHIDFVFGTFAKFHGISFAMKVLKPELYQKELVNKIYSGPNVFKEMFIAVGVRSQMGKLMNDLLVIFDKEKEKHLHDKFAEYSKDIGESLLALLEDTVDDSVVTQGDCWCNNMMFKYNNENSKTKPCDMRLLDFQLTRIGSPICDLSYFFYASASKDVLDNLDNHLKHYHKELSKYLKQYGVDVDEVYTFEKFLCDWKRYSRFGLNMAIFLRRIMLVDPDEAPDMSRAAEGDGDLIHEFNFISKNEGEYHRQVKELIQHFVQRNFI